FESELFMRLHWKPCQHTLCSAVAWRQNGFALLLAMLLSPSYCRTLNRFALLLEMLHSFSHFRTQNRFALLLEMLYVLNEWGFQKVPETARRSWLEDFACRGQPAYR